MKIAIIVSRELGELMGIPNNELQVLCSREDVEKNIDRNCCYKGFFLDLVEIEAEGFVVNVYLHAGKVVLYNGNRSTFGRNKYIPYPIMKGDASAEILRGIKHRISVFQRNEENGKNGRSIA
jgi:hypothetical protein